MKPATLDTSRISAQICQDLVHPNRPTTPVIITPVDGNLDQLVLVMPLDLTNTWIQETFPKILKSLLWQELRDAFHLVSPSQPQPKNRHLR